MDKGFYAYLVAAGLLAIFILAWRPLRERFRAWGVLFSYFSVGIKCPVTEFELRP